MSLKLLERQQQQQQQRRREEEGQEGARRAAPTTTASYRAQPQPPPTSSFSAPKIDSYGREVRSPSYTSRSQPPIRRSYDAAPPHQDAFSMRAPSQDAAVSAPHHPAPAPPPSQPFRSSVEAPRYTSSSSMMNRAPPASFSHRAAGEESNSLAAWSRTALESRVLTLERLLAESTSVRSSTAAPPPSDRELSEHLTVTVRKNRELRAELETCRQELVALQREREALFHKLNTDNDALQGLLQEATRGKEALAKCISQLSVEKAELRAKLDLALEEVEQLKSGGGALDAAPIIPLEELHSNVEEVSLIHDGLRESMRLMKIKTEQQQQQHDALNASKLNASALNASSMNRMFDE